ncbi:MAG: clostripain-related cysteine peptidase [Myxococcales bacterium]|nr:clostripain-related cysteine peptidase [Myxococcota bacterium]MDW8280070.1 clostripain-related cysteine peptidase [Myxococcales bacterium]
MPAGRLSATALLSLLVLGCAAPSRPPQMPGAASAAPAWFPARTCQQAWATLPEAARSYDLRRDGQLGPLGNLGYADWARPLHRSGCYKPWTVLIYMAADNDLAPYAYLDLYEMEAIGPNGQAGGSSHRVDVLVQLDTPGHTGIRRLHIFPSGEQYDTSLTLAQFAQRKEKDIRSPIVELLEEPAQADPARDLEAFLEWGMRRYPAERYMLVLWGHGEGWSPAQPPRQPATSRFLRAEEVDVDLPAESATPRNPFAGRGFRGGVVFDWTQAAYLDIPSLHRVLRNTSQRLLGRPLDVYVADACLMQMVEVATEISDSVRFIVGSAQVQDFLGLPYRDIMAHLTAADFGSAPRRVQTDDEAYLLAHLLPELYQASLDPNTGSLQAKLAPDAHRTVTMSALSSSELRSQLLPAMADLAARLSEYLAEDPLRSSDLRFVIQHTPSFIGSAQDVGAFLGMLELLLRREAQATPAVGPAHGRLQRAVNRTREALLRTVLSYAYGTEYRSVESQLHLLGFRAVSVWLPVSDSDFRARIEDFRPSAFYRYGAPSPDRPGPWERWLSQLYSP